MRAVEMVTCRVHLCTSMNVQHEVVLRLFAWCGWGWYGPTVKDRRGCNILVSCAPEYDAQTTIGMAAVPSEDTWGCFAFPRLPMYLSTGQMDC